RDVVRGWTPKDYDIATDARPETVQALFPRTYAVGAHFGVIIVLEDGFQFEVATFRSDDAYVDGRHPSAVHFSSPEADAKRRDFTINGMFYDPVAGEVIDLVGGQLDIAAMKGVLQPEQFHPEGDVFVHTRLMLSLLPETVSVPLVFAVLFHDVAKPVTATVDKTGRSRFNEHDRIGAQMTEAIMRRLRFSGAEIEATVEMVRQHMV